MKKILYFILPCLLIAACNKQEEPQNTPQEEIYTINISTSGEFSTADSPLTKTGDASNYLYAIRFIKIASNPVLNETFALGLFDSTEGISVNLVAGEQYIVQATLIKNGKELLTTDSQGRYNDYVISNMQLTNSFFYHYRRGIIIDYPSFSYDYSNLNTSVGRDGNVGKVTYQYDRYYGEIASYTPVVNGTINIELKHVAYGLKYKVVGLTDGSLALTVINAAPAQSETDTYTLFNVSGINSDTESDGSIFQCRDIYSAWQYPSTYKETVTLSLQWTRGIGITQDLGSVDIDVLRNRMNIININLGAQDGDASLGINTEDAEMGNESVTINVG